MICFFFKNHPKFSQPICFSKWEIGRDIGANRHFSGWQWVLFSLQIFRQINDVWRFFVKLNVPSVFDFKNCRPWLQRTLTPDNRVVSVGWKISSWTRLGSSGFGFSSFSSSVAAPSLVLNVDFNTCEWNELYYKYIRRLRQNKESRLQLIHRATQSLGLLGSSWQFKRFIKWRQFLTRGRELKSDESTTAMTVHHESG